VSRSPTGIIPESLIRYGKLGDVMEFLKALPIEGDIKVDLLVGWARMVGASINASQRDAVRQTGIDHQ
jgi:hypothetical protein